MERWESVHAITCEACGWELAIYDGLRNMVICSSCLNEEKNRNPVLGVLGSHYYIRNTYGKLLDIQE